MFIVHHHRSDWFFCLAQCGHYSLGEQHVNVILSYMVELLFATLIDDNPVLPWTCPEHVLILSQWCLSYHQTATASLNRWEQAYVSFLLPWPLLGENNRCEIWKGCTTVPKSLCDAFCTSNIKNKKKKEKTHIMLLTQQAKGRKRRDLWLQTKGRMEMINSGTWPVNTG